MIILLDYPPVAIDWFSKLRIARGTMRLTAAGSTRPYVETYARILMHRAQTGNRLSQRSKHPEIGEHVDDQGASRRMPASGTKWIFENIGYQVRYRVLSGRQILLVSLSLTLRRHTLHSHLNTKLTRGLMRCISAASTSAQLIQKPFHT
jgi:hypothetical protein